MTVCMQRPYCNGELENPQRTRQKHYSAELLSNKLSNCYSNASKEYWNNSDTIYFLNVILRTWDIFCTLGFLHTDTLFFLTQLHCLHNFQTDILSNKEAILRRCTKKQSCSYAKTMLCYRYFSRSFARIYKTLRVKRCSGNF